MSARKPSKVPAGVVVRAMSKRELGEAKLPPGSRRYVAIGTENFSPRTKTYSLRAAQQSRLGHSIEERGRRNRQAEARGEVLPKSRRQKRSVEARVAAVKAEETRRKGRRTTKKLKHEKHMLMKHHGVSPETFGYKPKKASAAANHAAEARASL